MMAKDALAAHARDELGLSDLTRARPLQAAAASAVTFAAGACLPVLVAFGLSDEMLVPGLIIVTTTLLATLGALAARAGGAPLFRGAARVAFWGLLAMGVTAGVGRIFGAVA